MQLAGGFSPWRHGFSSSFSIWNSCWRNKHCERFFSEDLNFASPFIVLPVIHACFLSKAVVDVTLPVRSVSPHCYSWYSRLQYQGTQYLLTATSGAVGCNNKGLSMTRMYLHSFFISASWNFVASYQNWR
jgi:hypothetical protein